MAKPEKGNKPDHFFSVIPTANAKKNYQYGWLVPYLLVDSLRISSGWMTMVWGVFVVESTLRESKKMLPAMLPISKLN